MKQVLFAQLEVTLVVMACLEEVVLGLGHALNENENKHAWQLVVMLGVLQAVGCLFGQCLKGPLSVLLHQLEHEVTGLQGGQAFSLQLNTYSSRIKCCDSWQAAAMCACSPKLRCTAQSCFDGVTSNQSLCHVRLENPEAMHCALRSLKALCSSVATAVCPPNAKQGK